MDSLDITNALVLKPDDLPAQVKEIISRLEPGDKLTLAGGTLTLVESGEKVIHFALNTGDSLSIKDPSLPDDAPPVTFEMGEGDDAEEANEDEPETDDEKPAGEKEPGESAAVKTLKGAAEPDEEAD